MIPRYVRIEDRQRVEAYDVNTVPGCLACGWYGGLSGPAHGVVTCPLCELPTCSGIESKCPFCMYGLRGRAVKCGYAGCRNPGIASAPRVRAVCREHLGRPKRYGITLSDLVASRISTQRPLWVLFPGT